MMKAKPAEAFYSTLAPRGRTNIPVIIRRALGLEAGDAIEYIPAGDQVIMRRAPAGIFDEPRSASISVAQIRSTAAAAAAHARSRR